MENLDTIWGFDVGKASLGFAVRVGDEIVRASSLIMDEDFGETKTAAALRRQWRTRLAHKAREKYLEERLRECGIEILIRREVGIVDGKWRLVSAGDVRLEKEFPSKGENICYNSIALRCKLILGEKLQGWQIFKALNSAIQNRGYDADIPWKETESGRTSCESENDYAERMSVYEREKSELFEDLTDGENFDYPCFFKANKMGLWSPKNPYFVALRIDNNAESTKNYVVPRSEAEREFLKLVESASVFYPKLKGRGLELLYGEARKPYASFFNSVRMSLGLKRGAESDWTAFGQKVPRFDNRIIDKCRLIPRLNACKIKPLAKITNEADLLPYQTTLLTKLLNLRFFRNGNVEGFTIGELKAAYDIGCKSKFKFTATALRKFLHSIGAEVLDEEQSKIEASREGGRASFSRPAMVLLKELILSGKTPAEFYSEKIRSVSNTDKTKGLVVSDFDFLKLMGACPWNAIFIPDVKMFALANAKETDSEVLINRLIGEQNDPVVRHRLSFFYRRIKELEKEFGVPDRVVLEFVREDFLGSEARKKRNIAMKKRADEKLRTAKKLDEIGFKGNKMLLKMELFQQQGGVCLYTGEPLEQTQIDSLEIEHIVPRSLGGPDSAYNYVLTRERTNKEKADRTPFQWLSADSARWASYCDRVRRNFASLGVKKCRLLMAQNAEELVEKYTALAETAWIAKLAQQIVCLHFGFQFGAMKGRKRVFTVSGGTTARIRGLFGLNRLLHTDIFDESKMTEVEIVKKYAELDKKNRKNQKHHALDAMCLCFVPVNSKASRMTAETLFPKKIRDNAENYFKAILDKIVPEDVARKKPRLEQTIYSARSFGGKLQAVYRVNIADLAYKNENQKKVYNLDSLQKSVNSDKIINPVIKSLVSDFSETNPTEEEWLNWCNTVRIPAKRGAGSRIKRVLVRKGNIDEYKDLSKDGCGAYKCGDANKSQIVWRDTKGKCRVCPVYVHASRFDVLEALKRRPDFSEIVGEFKSHCLVSIASDVFGKSGEKIMPAGTYMLNTIIYTGATVLTNPDGVKSKAVNINYLIDAGMKRKEGSRK